MHGHTKACTCSQRKHTRAGRGRWLRHTGGGFGVLKTCSHLTAATELKTNTTNDPRGGKTRRPTAADASQGVSDRESGRECTTARVSSPRQNTPLSLPLSLSLSLSPSLSLSLSLSHTHTLSLSHSHTRSPQRGAARTKKVEFPMRDVAFMPETPPPPRVPSSLLSPGANPGANRESISHRCYLREAAFAGELT